LVVYPAHKSLTSYAHYQFNIGIIRADITRDWTFCRVGYYDLVSFSLVLEHIQNLDPVFWEVAAALKPGGLVYMGELHPFKQYNGTKARFDTTQGQQVVDCYQHHVSDFVEAAKNQGLLLKELNEHFDDDDRTAIPRILTLIFQKP
jgi:SAM-dependent methyltransferase